MMHNGIEVNLNLKLVLLHQIEPPPHARWDIGDNWIKQPQKTCMLDWLTDRDGNIIADYILRYENLRRRQPTSMSKIERRTNISLISSREM